MALESAFTLYATSFVGDASAFSPSSPMCVCVLACLPSCSSCSSVVEEARRGADWTALSETLLIWMLLDHRRGKGE
jgi:hypothetical protein